MCWGSFLNVVGYRIIQGKSLLGRSFCPRCLKAIPRYDLIPVFSWFFLRGSCRSCKQPISFLYPVIELLTAITALLTYHTIPSRYWLGYGIFFSALIVVIRTDFETMLISRYTTWCMIPCAWFLASQGALPLTLTQSILGTLFGYGLLWCIARIFYALRSIEGLGEGDLDLMAMIGSYTGILGVWISLFVGSILGSFVGFLLLSKTRNRLEALPFGPWLSMGALLYVFSRTSILPFF